MNYLINKGMCVLLFDVTFTIEKNWCSQNFSEKWISQKERNALALKSKKVQHIIGETFILVLLSSAVFCLHDPVLNFFYIVFFGRWKAFIRVP